MSTIPLFDLGRFKAVAIGSSTGGPGLIQEIIAGLPADLSVPIFIAQHMPATFTQSFATRLDQGSPLTVVHAEDAMPVFPGTVYLGRGQTHLRVRSVAGRASIEVNEEPQGRLYKPSADELFQSCAKVYGKATLVIVMTGIGSDGTEGAKEIKDVGGVVLTQSKDTCAVYGMPRSCVKAGLSDAQLGPDEIRSVILQLSPDYRDRALV